MPNDCLEWTQAETRNEDTQPFAYGSYNNEGTLLLSAQFILNKRSRSRRHFDITIMTGALKKNKADSHILTNFITHKIAEIRVADENKKTTFQKWLIEEKQLFTQQNSLG